MPEINWAFDFQLRTRLVFGVDRIHQLGELAAEAGAKRALVVSDSGIVNVGHTQKGLEALHKSGVVTQVFSAFSENPSSDDVEHGAAVARDFRPDLFVGLGGGSSMDCAKGVNFVYSCGGKIQDYWGVGKATGPLATLITIPTTAGTGSETQSFALISDSQTHVKMACGDKRAASRVAILDPRLTLTQPRRVTALTGIDAISHAVESYVTRPRNEMSAQFSRESWRLLSQSIVRVFQEPNDLEARSRMLLGASLAGIAIECSMLGATHALANPLTAKFGVPHGQAIAILLPHVVRFNESACGAWYCDLTRTSAGFEQASPPESGAQGLAEHLERLVAASGLARNLKELNIPQSAFGELAAMATKQWTGTFNPRTVNESDFAQLYEQAF